MSYRERVAPPNLRAVIGRLGPTAVVLGLAWVALLLSFGSAPSQLIDLGGGAEESAVEQFYAPEQAEGVTHRWSSPGSRLLLHHPGGGATVVAMRMNGELRVDQPDRQIHVERDGAPIVGVELRPSWRTYQVLLPAPSALAAGLWPVALDLRTTPIFREQRALGAVFDWVRHVPLASSRLAAPALRALALVWGLAALAALLFSADRALAPRAARSRPWRVALPLSLVALSLIVRARRDPYALFDGFPAAWIAGLGLVAFAICWALGEGRPGTLEHGQAPRATRRTHAGVFLVALATLMYETLLARIFSVTMFYHFAFVAISIAMFGMTVGAVLVYLLPQRFTPERVKWHLALSAALFALAIVWSFLTHLSIPFRFDDAIGGSVVGIYAIVFTYLVISAPFVLSGVCITLAMTKFPGQVGRLYAADLLGAALGCILLVGALKVTDGPTAVVVAAGLAGSGAVFFALGEKPRGLQWGSVILTAALIAFAIFNTARLPTREQPLRLQWVRGEEEENLLDESWNSFSRIKVYGDPDALQRPFSWGLSDAYPDERKVRQLFLQIDSEAGAVLARFNGNWKDLDYLKYDVTNIAHYIRPAAKVLVVGVGGGRDVLSALVFDQKQVTGVEINGNIISALNEKFGAYTGYLAEDPRVRFVNDEARSYITREREAYDIMQISLIDTWAATTAGAFAFTENSLYTTEAWSIFLERLTPNGVLTVSRWYFGDRPGEVYRLTSLASTALKEIGVANPRDHIVIVRILNGDAQAGPEGVGTILVSKAPFSEEDLDTLEQVSTQMGFEVVLSPRTAIDNVFERLASGEDLQAFTAAYPINIAPPTDDSPFFFHMLRLRDIFNGDLQEQGPTSYNMKAVTILGILLLIVTTLTGLFLILPLWMTADRAALRGSAPFFFFFAAIGFGFMLVEISQMQRLNLFLGHPTYSLAVVLFTLLLSSGIGSSLTQRFDDAPRATSGRNALLLLLLVQVVFGLLTPWIVRQASELQTPLRIGVATAILFPMGLFMGMAFPLGMRLAAARSPALAPMLWGANGATSVCASVLAVAIALSSSISTTFWAGFACYVIAVGSYLWARREFVGVRAWGTVTREPAA